MDSGIYMIINMETMDFYIGSSINLSKRLSVHKRELLENRHHSFYLQKSFNKYGYNKFLYCIIELTINTKEREQYYIDTLSPKFNMSKSATCPMLGRKHSLDTINKFKYRNYSKGKTHHFYGKSWTDDMRLKILNKKTGSKRTIETKNKMSNTAKRINSISRINHDLLKRKIKDNFGNNYESLTEASIKTGIKIQCICDVLKGRSKKTRQGYVFEYYN